MVCAGGVNASTIKGEFWDTGPIGGFGPIATALASTPTATFNSTGIDYPLGAQNTVGSSTTLAAFLGTDAGSLSGAGGTTLEGSVFRFTGHLKLLALSNTFTVASDDGFRLFIEGTLVSEFFGNRPFGTTSATRADLGTGIKAFELIYWENGGVTGVEFEVNGRTVTPIPVGPALPMLAGALSLFGLVVARKRALA